VDVVRTLVIRGPSGPDWRHGALRVTGGRGPRDTYG
jgi:predicted nucleic acid-binding Zn ribbon protein